MRAKIKHADEAAVRRGVALSFSLVRWISFLYLWDSAAALTTFHKPKRFCSSTSAGLSLSLSRRRAQVSECVCERGN